MTHDENISTRLSTSNGNGKCRGTAPTTPGPGVLLAAALLVVAGTTLGFCLLRRLFFFGLLSLGLPRGRSGWLLALGRLLRPLRSFTLRLALAQSWRLRRLLLGLLRRGRGLLSLLLRRPGLRLGLAFALAFQTRDKLLLLRLKLRLLVAELIQGRLRPHFVALAQLRLAGQVLDTGDVPDVLADAVADGATLADNLLHVLSRETCCHSSPLLFLGLGDAGRFQSNCYCLLLLAAGLHEFTDVFSNRLSAFALFQRNDALPSQISTPARSRVPTVITQLHSNCLRLGTERATAHATTPGGFMFSVSSVQ